MYWNFNRLATTEAGDKITAGLFDTNDSNNFIYLFIFCIHLNHK